MPNDQALCCIPLNPDTGNCFRSIILYFMFL
jgi:hypothetical protein